MGGCFRAFADFTANGTALTLGLDVVTDGERRALDPSGPNTVSRVDAYEVRVLPQALRVGEPTLLSFAVTRDGRPVEDLEPYLGAMATSWLSDAAT